MASYTEHPVLAIFDELNPAPQHAASLNLDDSEEEVELEEDAYEGVGHGDMAAGKEEGEFEEGDSQEESHNHQVSVRRLDRELPPPPQFNPLINDSPEHTQYLTLPPEFGSHSTAASTNLGGGRGGQLTLKSFFQLYFSDVEFNTLAENTNAYAEYKNAGRRGRK